MKEKEKILSDLEKAEKLKNQLATEVDEHHSAIEHKNNLNLRSPIAPQKCRKRFGHFFCVEASHGLSGCPQEAWAGPQGEAVSSEIGADEGDGPAQAAGGPAARGAGSRDPENQGGWVFSQRPPLHLSEGTKNIANTNVSSS